MQTLTLRRRIAISALLAAVTLQAGIPLGQWVRAQQPARFGWQMYATARSAPLIRLHYTTGEIQDVRMADSVASMRPDVPFERFLTPHYCTRVAGLLAVEYTTATSSEVQPCSHS